MSPKYLSPVLGKPVGRTRPGSRLLGLTCPNQKCESKIYMTRGRIKQGIPSCACGNKYVVDRPELLNTFQRECVSIGQCRPSGIPKSAKPKPNADDEQIVKPLVRAYVEPEREAFTDDRNVEGML